MGGGDVVATARGKRDFRASSGNPKSPFDAGAGHYGPTRPTESGGHATTWPGLAAGPERHGVDRDSGVRRAARRVGAIAIRHDDHGLVATAAWKGGAIRARPVGRRESYRDCAGRRENTRPAWRS